MRRAGGHAAACMPERFFFLAYPDAYAIAVAGERKISMGIDRLEAQKLGQELLQELDFRICRPVTAVQCLRLNNRMTSFPICPKCGCTFEREYQSFCDRCGQRLDWSDFEKAVLVLPGGRR